MAQADRLLEIRVSRFLPCLALATALSTGLAASLTAQERPSDPDDSWAVRAIVDVGMRVGTRDLGTNGGISPLTQRLAVRSAIDPVPVVGAGVELQHRRSIVGVRAMARTTLGGTYRGRPGACVLIEGSICDGHESDARVSSFSVEALFSTRREADARVTLSMGGGLRHYDFGEIECSTDDLFCSLVRQIQDDQLQPLFTFGLTLDGHVEGVPVHIKIQDFLGSFRARSLPAEGQLQNDLIVTLGVGFPFD